MVQTMSFSELEALRREKGLGVNVFLAVSGLSKSSYYRRKQKAQTKTKELKEKRDQAIKALCHEHPALGYRPIHALLLRHYPSLSCSASTVYRLMKALDLCQKPVKKKPVKSTTTPLELESIGMTIGLDFTHWQKAPICNVLEYESRYALATIVTDRETAQAAKSVMELALLEAQRLGLPTTGIEVKSDQGSTFTAEVFEDFLYNQGCQHSFSPVAVPQGMAKVERFNRSAKEQALAREECDSKEAIQDVLDSYRQYYNSQRPHQALGYKTPLDIIRQFQAGCIHPEGQRFRSKEKQKSG